MPKPLHFSAFTMITPGADGAWRDPENTRDYLSLSYWQQQARVIEAAGFDAMFFADILGVFETRESGIELSVRDAHVFPLADPFVLVSALAAVTEKLGFVVTASTTYEPPFLLARRFSTLDHLTDGRIGWNIVTSYLDSAAANFGLREQVDHTERYVRADEYIDVVEKLWLRSWDDEALRKDATSGVYADPAHVHPIDHSGKYFSVRGPHSLEPSPQRKPVFFQATASATGLGFAARHAEAVYTQGGSITQLRDVIERLRTASEEAGRPAPKVFAGVNIAVGRTGSEARAKAERAHQFKSEESALAWNGIDIRQYPRDTLLSALQTFGTTRPLRSVDGRLDVTIQEYIDYSRTRRSPLSAVGTPDEVVDRLIELRDEAGLDGFSISADGRPGLYEDFAEYLTPVLRERGLLAETADQPRQLRDRIRADEIALQS